METLILVCLEATVARTLAIRMIQVFDSAGRNPMEFLSYAGQISAASYTRVDEGQRKRLKTLVAALMSPGPFKLEVQFARI